MIAEKSVSKRSKEEEKQQTYQVGPATVWLLIIERLYGVKETFLSTKETKTVLTT